MSKKSRKRNKKILAVLAAGLGAAALMKRRKSAAVASSDDAGIGVKHSALTGPFITKKDTTTNVIPKKKPVIQGTDWGSIRGPHGAGGKKAMHERIADQKYETGEHYTPDLSPYTPRVFKRAPVKRGQKDGGRIGAKHGGRTRKQFGGGLNRPVARPVGGVGAAVRPVGGVGAPVRPLGYKKGGHVKSMGIAKRGGGAAKR